MYLKQRTQGLVPTDVQLTHVSGFLQLAHPLIDDLNCTALSLSVMRGSKSISLRPPATQHSEIFQVPWILGQIALQEEQFLLGFSPGQALAENRGRSWGRVGFVTT